MTVQTSSPRWLRASQRLTATPRSGLDCDEVVLWNERDEVTETPETVALIRFVEQSSRGIIK